MIEEVEISVLWSTKSSNNDSSDGHCADIGVVVLVPLLDSIC